MNFGLLHAACLRPSLGFCARYVNNISRTAREKYAEFKFKLQIATLLLIEAVSVNQGRRRFYLFWRTNQEIWAQF